MSRLLARVAVFGVVAGCGGSPSAPSPSPMTGPVNMTFFPQDQRFADAAEAYGRLWADEGARITEALQGSTRLTFVGRNIPAVIYEGPSTSGNRDIPMFLRASYTTDEKRAAVVHELGHRLIAQLTTRPSDLDEHRVLDLFLYDVWESLWGMTFADAQVVVESGRTGLYDYASAWKWALSLGKAERAFHFAAIVNANRPLTR
jgi:hypothetical protein